MNWYILESGEAVREIPEGETAAFAVPTPKRGDRVAIVQRTKSYLHNPPTEVSVIRGFAQVYGQKKFRIKSDSKWGFLGDQNTATVPLFPIDRVPSEFLELHAKFFATKLLKDRLQRLEETISKAQEERAGLICLDHAPIEGL